jgi:hypothetical protein
MSVQNIKIQMPNAQLLSQSGTKASNPELTARTIHMAVQPLPHLGEVGA